MAEKQEQLISYAKRAYENSYSPYSGYAVGAAVLCKDGSIYIGTNVESVSFPAGMCAERAAFSAAIVDGKRKFTAVAVYSDKITTPCGVCRQALSEFGDMFVICADKRGSTKNFSLSRLLPEAFSNLSK